MSAQATETRSAAAVGDLAELILAAHGDAAAGARLPTERELVTELGVTRTAIRHALAILEAQGRVSREVGRGTFVRAAGARVSAAVDDGADAAPSDFGPA